MSSIALNCLRLPTRRSSPSRTCGSVGITGKQDFPALKPILNFVTSCNMSAEKNSYEIELLEEFIYWARDCGEDAFYIFDNMDEAIERFLKQRDK